MPLLPTTLLLAGQQSINLICVSMNESLREESLSFQKRLKSSSGICSRARAPPAPGSSLISPHPHPAKDELHNQRTQLPRGIGLIERNPPLQNMTLGTTGHIGFLILS